MLTWPIQDGRMNVTKKVLYFRSYSHVKFCCLNDFFNIIGHILTLKFVVLMIFYFNIFGQIHPYFVQVQCLMFIGLNFRSSLKVNVCRCELFLVKFQQIFGQIDWVKITSLKCILMLYSEFIFIFLLYWEKIIINYCCKKCEGYLINLYFLFRP